MDIITNVFLRWYVSVTVLTPFHQILELFVQHFKQRLSNSIQHGSTASQSLEPWEIECVLLSLAALFVRSPSKLGAFSQLVPDVFNAHLKLGSEPREKLNKILLKTEFDPRFEYLIAQTDDFVGAPFFWNDQEGFTYL